MTVFGYLMLISIDFLRFYFSVLSIVLVSIEKILISNTHLISEQLEGSSKTAARHIFNSLRGVWKCGQTRSFVFDLLLEQIKKEKNVAW